MTADETTPDDTGRAVLSAQKAKVFPDDYGWGDLMTLLDCHWPADIFGGTDVSIEDLESGDRLKDAGVRIVALLRWVDRLAAEVERLRGDAGDWRRECLRWRDEAGTEGSFDALVAERDAARAESARLAGKVAAVEVLADEWERTVYKLPPGYPMTVNRFCVEWFKAPLRAALSSVEVADTEGGDGR